MTISREDLVKKMKKKSGYWVGDIRKFFNYLDEIVLESFEQASEDEEVTIQLVRGCKIGCKVVEERQRVNPQTREPIIVPETYKPFAKFSEDFKQKIQKTK